MCGIIQCSNSQQWKWTNTHHLELSRWSHRETTKEPEKRIHSAWGHLYKVQKEARLKSSVRKITGIIFLQEGGKSDDEPTNTKGISDKLAMSYFWIWEVIHRGLVPSNFLRSMLRECQTEKDKDCMIWLISRILNSATIQCVKQKGSQITDTENKLVVSHGKGRKRQCGGWGMRGTNSWV